MVARGTMQPLGNRRSRRGVTIQKAHHFREHAMRPRGKFQYVLQEKWSPHRL
jgi:hypothetical protein